MRLQKQSKFLPHFMATLLAATMLVAPLPAQAAVGTCTVTTGADDVDNPAVGSLRECSERLNLSEAGYEDGIRIEFSVSQVTLDAPVVFFAPNGSYSGLFDPISLVGPVTITPSDEFSNLTVDVFTFDRLLSFLGGDVVLNGLSLNNAFFGAVDAEGADSFTVSNSSFTSNDALAGSGRVSGAAIWSNTQTTIQSSQFVSNRAEDQGGAVYVDDDTYILDSHFESNSANDGGALAIGDHGYISRSSFVSNLASNNGGALDASFDDEDETSIVFSTFYNNVADTGYGGAVYQDEEDVAAVFSTFVDNEALQDGHAIYADSEDVSAFASIFANSFGTEGSLVYSSEDTWDYGANIFTDQTNLDYPSVSSISSLDVHPASELGVEFEALSLGELTELDNGTYAFIPDSSSIAGSLVNLDLIQDTTSDLEGYEGYDFIYDLMLNEDEVPVDQSGTPLTNLVSAGSIDFFTQLQPVQYLGPVVTNDPETAQSGSTVTYTGSDLDEVTSATIAGQSAAIVSKTASALTLRVPAGLTQGMHDVILHYSTTESLTLQNGLVVQDLMKVWTQLQSDNTVKMYAKNIVGEGKIQFFHNNQEIAWVRATNALNPKLRQANGSSYLVRTRELVAGKNAFEIYQDGKRIWRAAYSN